MNTSEIIAELCEVRNFAGVFASDSIPLFKVRPVLMVANTDPRSKPGEHWVGIILINKRRAEYFDSFGFPPYQQHLVKYMKSVCEEFVYNKKTIQHPTTRSCGEFCVDFIRKRSEGWTLEEYGDFFTKDLRVNEIMLDTLKDG